LTALTVHNAATIIWYRKIITRNSYHKKAKPATVHHHSKLQRKVFFGAMPLQCGKSLQQYTNGNMGG
jgi:hypothetical protein